MISPRLTNLISQASQLTLRVPRQVVRTPFLSRTMAAKADSETISKITEKEREITGKAQPVKGGPTAEAQKHAGEDLTSNVISDITKGEQKITGGERLKGGPTSAAQSMASKSTSAASSNSTSTSSASYGGALDSDTISKISEKEREITGLDHMVKGGPTAQAQKHANEPITSEALHDITEGEKKIAGDRLAGGPTSAAQSALGKARNQGNA